VSEEEREPVTVAELRGTDFFRKMEYQLSNAGIEIDLNSILNQYRAFDTSRTGFIQAYILINVLKHNYPSVFSDDCLLGLQFQMECLSADGTVDYQEFTKLFLEDSGKSKPAHEIRLERK
jgi:Ca2+-binding EF-hand superfamily protein